MAAETDPIYADTLYLNQRESRPVQGSDQPAEQPTAVLTSFVNWRPPSLLAMLAIFTLERCSYYNYMSNVINAGDGSVPYCGALQGTPTEDPWWNALNLQLPQCFSFLLPLFGGYLADRFIGCAKLLTIGCFAYHIGAWMLVALVHYPAVCHIGLAIACKVFLVCSSGLLRPCLLALTIESGLLQASSVRHVCQMYYMWESLGQVLGYLLAFGSDKLNFPLGFVCVPTTALMMLLAIGARDRPDWNPREFELPGWGRIKRVMIFAESLIVLSSGVLLGYFTLSVLEVFRHIQQADPEELRLGRDFLMLCYSVALFAATVVLVLATRTFNAVRDLPDIRIAIGIAATAFAHLMAPSVALLTQSSALWAIVITLNFFHAIAEAFAITTTDEVSFRCGFVSSRTVTIGLFMGFWGSGYVFGAIIERLHLHSAYVHLGTGVSLLIAFAYFAKLGVPALYWLLNGR